MLVDRHGNPIKQNSQTKSVVYRRVTRDRDEYVPALGSILAPEDDHDWKLSSLEEKQLSNMDFHEVLNILIDSCPDLNAALALMQMYVNTRYEITIVEDDPAAMGIINDALDTMANQRKEPLSAKLDKLVASGYLKGAFHFENVFSDDEPRDFLNIAVVDPLRVRFNQVDDPQLGQYDEIGQEINGQFIPFDSEFVHYYPMNPVDNKPFGRSMVSASIFPMIFLLGLIKSGRQVIETQAWPYQIAKVDPKVYYDIGMEDSNELMEKVDETVDKVNELLNTNERGAQFVFDSAVSVDHVGSMSRRNLDAVDMIEKILKRWIIISLRQVPVLFAITEGGALSSNAEVQLESYSIFIGSFQDKLEEVITTCLTQILRVAGNASTPVFKLTRINTLVERFRAERMKIIVESVMLLLQNGVINAQEARDIIRTPDALSQLGHILDEPIPSDARNSVIVEEEVV